MQGANRLSEALDWRLDIQGLYVYSARLLSKNHLGSFTFQQIVTRASIPIRIFQNLYLALGVPGRCSVSITPEHVIFGFGWDRSLFLLCSVCTRWKAAKAFQPQNANPVVSMRPLDVQGSVKRISTKDVSCEATKLQAWLCVQSRCGQLGSHCNGFRQFQTCFRPSSGHH